MRHGVGHALLIGKRGIDFKGDGGIGPAKLRSGDTDGLQRNGVGIGSGSQWLQDDIALEHGFAVDCGVLHAFSAKRRAGDYSGPGDRSRSKFDVPVVGRRWVRRFQVFWSP